MFGMGFAEILIIGVIAILFLGPDKLPQTMIEIAKFFKNVKRTVTNAKESIDEELHLNEIKEQAQKYKDELNEASNELDRLTSLDEIKHEVNEIKDAAKVSIPEPQTQTTEKKAPEVVTFKKKSKANPSLYADATAKTTANNVSEENS